MEKFRDALRPGVFVTAVGGMAFAFALIAGADLFASGAFPGEVATTAGLTALACTLIVVGTWLLSRTVALDGDRIIRSSWGNTVSLGADEISSMRIQEETEHIRHQVFEVMRVTLVGAQGATIRFKARHGALPSLPAFLERIALSQGHALNGRLVDGIPWGTRVRVLPSGLEIQGHGAPTHVAHADVARTTKIPAGLSVFRMGDIDPIITLPLDVDNALALKLFWEGLRSRA